LQYFLSDHRPFLSGLSDIRTITGHTRRTHRATPDHVALRLSINPDRDVMALRLSINPGRVPP